MSPYTTPSAASVTKASAADDRERSGSWDPWAEDDDTRWLLTRPIGGSLRTADLSPDRAIRSCKLLSRSAETRAWIGVPAVQFCQLGSHAQPRRIACGPPVERYVHNQHVWAGKPHGISP